MNQIIVEATDAVQIAVDGLSHQTFVQQVVDEGKHRARAHLLDRLRDPDHKVLERTHVVSQRVPRAVATLKKSTVVDNRIGNRHGRLPFRSWPSPESIPPCG